MIFRKINIKKLFISGLVSLLLISCYKEIFFPEENNKKYNYYLAFNDIQVGIDQKNRFMLCSIESLNTGSWTVNIFGEPIEVIGIDGVPVSNNGSYTFEAIEFTKNYTVEILLPDGSHENYTLMFTPMPVIQIYAESEIQKEPKIASWVTISDGGAAEKMIFGYMGIEYRGGSAAWKPKRSFGIEFWEDMYEGGHDSYSFFGLLADDDWILDAMYIDKARMRKALSFELWKDIQKDRLPELPVRTTSSQGGYVEVFLNGEFCGLYHMSERIDRKRLELARSDTELRGVIYKSEDWQPTTMYTGMLERGSGLVWGGWELKYPKHLGDLAWDPLYYYLDFAINSSDEDFKEHIFGYIDRGSTIDFFLFINAIKALDNHGKNIIMSRFDENSPFLFIPWDLDATWGRTWQAEESSALVILKNNLFDRLIELNPDNFRQELMDRWEELKLTCFDIHHINSMIYAYRDYLFVSGAIQRDSALWPETEVMLASETQYMQNWYVDRLAWLDDYFKTLSAD